ncbi:MAG: hypothetical protein P8L18_07745 [Verrucomicrobiota bacterium]|nr:hypothetical protein [Verrucomicrobiota bacterium]
MNIIKKLYMPWTAWFGMELLACTLLTGAELEKESIQAHWLFASHRQQGQKMIPIVGGPRPIFRGHVKFVNDPMPPRVELDNKGGRLVLSETLKDANLPAQSFAIESWVRIDEKAPWGGIIGAVQEDTEASGGWILTQRQDRFCFGLATEEGSGLTYIDSTSRITLGKWHHVVAQYDGSKMELWVDGILSAKSGEQRGKIRYPKEIVYEIGAYHNKDHHHPMTGAIHEIYVLKQPLTPPLIQSRYSDKRDYFPRPGPEPSIMSISYGPFVDWLQEGKARISWEVDVAMPTQLDLMGPEGEFRQFKLPQVSGKHAVVFDNLQRDGEYKFRIHGPDHGKQTQFSRLYEFDTSFYYAPVAAAEPEKNAGLPPSLAEIEPDIASLLNTTGREMGYALLLGASKEQRQVAHALARLSGYKIILVDPSNARVQEARSELDEAGVYGERVSVHEADFKSLPYGPFFANLVFVTDKDILTSTDEGGLKWVTRMLRPAGGALCIALAKETPEDHIEHLSSPLDDLQWSTQKGSRKTWLVGRRGELVGAGDWSHQYGGVDNSSCSQDALVHGDLSVLWWGDPGPRPMPDRGPRNPAPISVNGRLFIQGDRVLFGLDSYNGTILWNYFSPEMRRANVPRDCSNMIGTHDYLYIAQGRHCIGVEGDTGNRKLRFEVVRPEGSSEVDWGYLASVRDTLIGSSVKSGSRYLGDDGEWFEDYHPEDVSRVVSNGLFGLDRHSGESTWNYVGGAIINSTITIGKGEIFFLESRHQKAILAETGRVAPELLTDVRLVCLDLESGQPKWERTHDFSACQFTTYMTFSNDTLVVTGADKDKHYHTFAFNTSARIPEQGDQNQTPVAAGSLLWEESHEAGKNHHSGHLQHPVVIGDVFYSDQRAFSLRDGKLLRTDLPERRGCGTMSAALNSIFYRHYYHGQWDLQTNKRVQFEGLRSGCWLGMIPAGGLLLVPEASAGCSCANAIQTSVGYVPQHLDPDAFARN